MTWIEEANRDRTLLQERERLISTNEVAIYEGLWDEIKRQVKELQGTFPELRTNGKPMAHMIWMPVAPIPPQTVANPRELHLMLRRDKHEITASEPPVKNAVTFLIDVSADAEVGLTLDDHEIPYSVAAMYVLRPFLYAELPPLTRPYRSAKAWVA